MGFYSTVSSLGKKRATYYVSTLSRLNEADGQDTRGGGPVHDGIAL